MCVCVHYRLQSTWGYVGQTTASAVWTVSGVLCSCVCLWQLCYMLFMMFVFLVLLCVITGQMLFPGVSP